MSHMPDTKHGHYCKRNQIQSWKIRSPSKNKRQRHNERKEKIKPAHREHEKVKRMCYFTKVNNTPVDVKVP